MLPLMLHNARPYAVMSVNVRVGTKLKMIKKCLANIGPDTEQNK